MTSSIHFINTYNVADEKINSDYSNPEYADPLQEISDGNQFNYYRINTSVFAEPLKIYLNENGSFKDYTEKPGNKEDDIVAIENVLVHKRKGRKYKKYHMDIGSSDLSCPQSNCNRTFSTVKLLKAHIRKVHCADKNSYICEQCGRGFASRYLLERHTAVHEKRTVQCSVCAVVLSERTSISAHMRTHSGIKPHCCSVCNKRFTRKSTMETHIKFVHRSGQLECTKCDDRFDTRSQWTRHTSTYHRAQSGDKTAN